MEVQLLLNINNIKTEYNAAVAYLFWEQKVMSSNLIILKIIFFLMINALNRYLGTKILKDVYCTKKA